MFETWRHWLGMPSTTMSAPSGEGRLALEANSWLNMDHASCPLTSAVDWKLLIVSASCWSHLGAHASQDTGIEPCVSESTSSGEFLEQRQMFESSNGSEGRSHKCYQPLPNLPNVSNICILHVRRYGCVLAYPRSSRIAYEWKIPCMYPGYLSF